MPTKASARVVVDTNALISRLLLVRSVPGQALRKAVADCQLLVSDATNMDWPTFSAVRSSTPMSQSGSARSSCVYSTALPIESRSQVCRDPKDDKFLELAVNGAAQLIITGDADLLALHPFRRTEILTPARYLAR